MELSTNMTLVRIYVIQEEQLLRTEIEKPMSAADRKALGWKPESQPIWQNGNRISEEELRPEPLLHKHSKDTPRDRSIRWQRMPWESKLEPLQMRRETVCWRRADTNRCHGSVALQKPFLTSGESIDTSGQNANVEGL
jgi:hypothetical protein